VALMDEVPSPDADRALRLFLPLGGQLSVDAILPEADAMTRTPDPFITSVLLPGGLFPCKSRLFGTRWRRLRGPITAATPQLAARLDRGSTERLS
jgi:hypothetical protein